MKSRLAVGEVLDLQKTTRRRNWRDFKLTKEHIITPDGHRLTPLTLARISHLVEKTDRTMQECSALNTRIWKLEKALRFADPSAWRALHDSN